VIYTIGILNCTPDSFSDGSDTDDAESRYARAMQMIDAGAAGIDIGGDSSRPGSVCVGVEEEWRRIGGLVARLARHSWVSVDTHHVEVARRAIECGARCINDIGGGSDAAMRDLVARSGVQYIFMCSASGVPHSFESGASVENVFERVQGWISERVRLLLAAGIAESNLIADTGMGAFVSADPRASYELLRRYGELNPPQGGLLLGVSRKGFLRRPDELGMYERDTLSSFYGVVAAVQLAQRVPLYLRVHQVGLQQQCLLHLSLT
jgi:dihydropteroate synthase